MTRASAVYEEIGACNRVDAAKELLCAYCVNSKTYRLADRRVTPDQQYSLSRGLALNAQRPSPAITSPGRSKDRRGQRGSSLLDKLHWPNWRAAAPALAARTHQNNPSQLVDGTAAERLDHGQA